MPAIILSIAVPTPLLGGFDYLLPAGCSDSDVAALTPGIRISVSFGPRTLVGFLLAVKHTSDYPRDKLKPALSVIDLEPVFSPDIFSLCKWAADYYHHSLGNVLQHALPALLRDGLAATYKPQRAWQLTTHGKGLAENALSNARSQQTLLTLLRQDIAVSRNDLTNAGINLTAAKALIDKGLAEEIELIAEPILSAIDETKPPLTLNPEQTVALTALLEHSENYQSFLLEGVTGSGKTEVYLQFISHILDQGKQALVLVPEIGLTPQTQQRFAERFKRPVLVLHSGLNERQRLDAWLSAKSGQAAIVIGTRSALFTPFKNLGVIIIDEEHDISLKQQDGFRFSARDAAIIRARDNNIPIVLGSATPSLESLHNAASGRSIKLKLTQRAGDSQLPQFKIIDIKNQPLQAGISQQCMQQLQQTLSKGEQALVFLNRRGFAPSLLCHQCGWLAECNRCDARMTLHLSQRKLHCHHCDTMRPLPRTCPNCNDAQLITKGEGTEQIEQSLNNSFPQYSVIRIDSGTTTGKDALNKLLTPVHAGEPCIMVGTQMLAKGHHFSKLALVVVVNADGGFFSADFRGPEKTAQLLMQVAGRAGREDKQGLVMLQTHYPDNPQLGNLLANGYQQFAQDLVAERKLLNLPPFGYMAMIRAEGTQPNQLDELLLEVKNAANCGAHITGPLPAPMIRRAGRFRAQLIVQSSERRVLHYALKLAEERLVNKKRIGHIRWSIDVDPQEMG
ncbi:MAG: primosomal protein N' (replication factor Y) [Pseudomonadales bacterium]|jgi:primosomal protein N' (replication factor Y)